MIALSIQPKGQLEQGCPKCPNCGQWTNPYYKWYPALDCWSCGRVMWIDDKGRTITQRGEESKSTGTVLESEDDKRRVEISKACRGE